MECMVLLFGSDQFRCHTTIVRERVPHHRCTGTHRTWLRNIQRRDRCGNSGKSCIVNTDTLLVRIGMYIAARHSCCRVHLVGTIFRIAAFLLDLGYSYPGVVEWVTHTTDTSTNSSQVSTIVDCECQSLDTRKCHHVQFTFRIPCVVRECDGRYLADDIE